MVFESTIQLRVQGMHPDWKVRRYNFSVLDVEGRFPKVSTCTVGHSKYIL